MVVPTIQEIKNNIIQDIEARLNQNVKLLPKAFIRVLSAVLTGIMIQLYKYIGWLFLQIFVTTASYEESEIFGTKITPLIEWGRLFTVGDPTPAIQTILNISVNVEILDSVLPAGTQFTSVINNVIYITTQDYTLNTNPKIIQVTAVTAGIIGNLDAGSIVTTINPLAEIEANASINSTDTLGIDRESELAYRTRVLQKKQSEPQGGSYTDYRIWSVEVASVINAYPYSGDPGQALVYIECDRTVFVDGIPDSAKLLEVANTINQANRRPITAIIDPDGDQSYKNIKPITRKSFDVDVKDLVTSNLAAVKQNIENALNTYFYSREPFIDGLTSEPRKDKITLPNVLRVVDDIVTAAAGTFTGVAVRDGVTPISTYILLKGETAKLGTLSYV